MTAFRSWRLFALVVLVAAPAWTASAETVAAQFYFVPIGNYDSTNAAIAQAQLGLTISGTKGGSSVDFLFTNKGPAASSITDIYFDDGSTPVLDKITGLNGVGLVKFTDTLASPVHPGDLPGGTELDPDFNVTAGLAADSDSGKGGLMKNGVNPGESLRISFSLEPGKTIFDVLEEMPNNPQDLLSGRGNYDLRVGIHVQGFANGGSLSMVAVPLPPAAYGGFGLLVAAIGVQFVRSRAALA